MKTRTLLLLSVGTGLLILLAGGLWLVQLAAQDDTLEPTSVGQAVQVGDVEVTVLGSVQDGSLLSIDTTLGGVDDLDGIDDFRLITGESNLAPVTAPAAGRCTEITVQQQTCALQFDVDGSDAPNLVLVMRRGEDVARWDDLRP